MKPPSDSFNSLVPHKTQPALAEPGCGYDYVPLSESGSLLDYWSILRCRKGGIILMTLFGGLLALLVTLPQAPVYQAKVSLEVQGLNRDFMDLRLVSPINEGAIDLTRESIDTQVEILKSDALVERTLKKLGWIEHRASPSGTDYLFAWHRLFNLPGKTAPEGRQVLLEQAREDLRVKAQGQTRIIQIFVDSTDPKLAADFANTLTDEFIDEHLEARLRMTQRTREWLTKQIEEMRITWERSANRLQSYTRKSGLMFTETHGSVAEEKLRQLQEELSRAQADRIAKQSRFELIKSSPPEALADILEDSTLRGYQTELTALRGQESELITTFTPGHLKVKRVRAQIETRELAFERQSDAVIQRIRNDYEEAARREMLLDLSYTQQAKLVTQESERAIQYNILKREVESNRQLYETMLERVRAASVASALRASNVRVIDSAKPPKLPYKPRVALFTVLGLMLGGFLGVLFTIMRVRMDRILHAPGDAQFYLNLPELGVIPKVLSVPSLYSVEERQKPNSLSTPSSSPMLGRIRKETESQKPEFLFSSSSSSFSESFRAMHASILFSGGNGERLRVIVLTSANPAEGKTTVATNLALALAQVNQKVLLIDGDLRKPNLHEIFGIKQEHGLSDLLKNYSPLCESLNGSIRETTVPKLFLLPSGEESSTSMNLLCSDRMSGLLKLFRRQFDTVLIDAPPVMQMPDARFLGHMADAVILVVRAGKTTRDDAQAARARLAEDGSRILGMVLNSWDPQNSDDRYGAYGKYRGYGAHT